MISFIKRLGLFILPVFIAVVVVNYWGDAANLFSGTYERDIATKIAEGKNVTNIQNCDERLLQKAIISKMTYCPATVVLGSSRVMEIRSGYAGDSASFFNNGVSGATFEDILAIIQLYENKSCMPQSVIIGLDPWMLNKNNEQIRWKSLNEEYAKKVSAIGLSELSGNDAGIVQKAKSLLKRGVQLYQLVSPSYFKNSVRSLWLGSKKVEVVAGDLNNTFTKLSDGSVSYDTAYRNVTPQKINQRINDFVSSGLYSLENFTELDVDNKKKLVALVKYLIDRKVRIEFVLSPYHPAVYKHILQDRKYHMVVAAEKWYVQLATDYNIIIRGTYNPDVLPHKAVFYDGMHCDDYTIRNIISK